MTRWRRPRRALRCIRPATVCWGWPRWPTRQRLAAGPPDLVLLDLGLPDGSGLTLTRQLAAVRVPVVIVTSRAALSERVLGLTLGAQDYLTKPLGLAELVACVAAVLRRAADRPRFAERG